MAKRKDGASSKKSLEELRAELDERKAILKELKKLDAQEAELLGDPEDDDEKAAKYPGKERVEKILAELKGSGSFCVSRIDAGKSVRVGTYDLDTWPEAMEHVVKQNGGGDYVVTFNDGDGKLVGRVSRSWTVPGGPKPATAPAAIDTMKLFELLERRDAAARAEVEALRAASDRSRDELLKMMMETVKAGSRSMVNGLQDIMAIRKMFDTGERPSLLDQIDELEEARERLRGGVRAEEQDPITAIIGRAMDTFGDVLRRGKIQPPPPASAPAPAALPSPAPATALTPQSTPAAPAKISLAGYVANFKAAIAEGVGAEVAAQYAWDSTAGSADDRAGFIALYERGDWESLYTDPFLNQHRAWIDAFKAKLGQLINPPPPPAAAPAPEIPAAPAAAAAEPEKSSEEVSPS